MQSTDNDTVKRNYLNFFPSAGLTFSPSRTNVFQLNYSRRIDRPRYQDLNPFQFKLDELSFREGNPFLQPQYTHNLQLSHTYKYTLNTSVSLRLYHGLFHDGHRHCRRFRQFHSPGKPGYEKGRDLQCQLPQVAHQVVEHLHKL